MSSWDWTEVLEGTAVSLVFIVAPLGWRLEKHRKESQQRHRETMAAHEKTHKHLEGK